MGTMSRPYQHCCSREDFWWHTLNYQIGSQDPRGANAHAGLCSPVGCTTGCEDNRACASYSTEEGLLMLLG
jgi:hypothetical protein